MWNVFMMRIITLITVEMISGPSCLTWCLHTLGDEYRRLTSSWPFRLTPEIDDCHRATSADSGARREYRNKISKYLPPICTCTQFSLYFGKNMEGKDLFYFHHYQVNHIYHLHSSLTIILHFYITTYRCQMCFREDGKKEKIPHIFINKF